MKTKWAIIIVAVTLALMGLIALSFVQHQTIDRLTKINNDWSYQYQSLQWEYGKKLFILQDKLDTQTSLTEKYKNGAEQWVLDWAHDTKALKDEITELQRQLAEKPKEVEKFIEIPAPVSDNLDYLKNWTLGKNIHPSFWPGAKGQFDCDDADLYTYYWINFMRPDYKIEIRYGWDPNPTVIIINGQVQYPKEYHVWLVVSDNTSKIAYDNSFPIDYPAYYTTGYPISLARLVDQVRRDLR